MTDRHHKLILTDGTVTVLDRKPAFDAIRSMIGCDTLDIVTLQRGAFMYVDDTGMIDGRPVNHKATARYHQICRPGTIFQIHGPVVIINDTVDT